MLSPSFFFCLLNNILGRVWSSTVEPRQRVKGTGNQWESYLNESASQIVQESIRDLFYIGFLEVGRRTRACNPVIDACHQQHIHSFPPSKLRQILPHSTSSQSYSWSQDFKWGMIITLIAIPGRTDSHDVGSWQQFNYFRVMMWIAVRGQFGHHRLSRAIINMIKCAALETLLLPSLC